MKLITNTKINRGSKIKCFLFLLFAVFSISGWCSKIIYPWRATTAIVKAGGNFEVWFDADDGQVIDSIIIEGPYKSVIPTFNVVAGSWIYDKWSGYTFNQKITVQVPEDAPADRYNLVLKTSTGDVTSFAAVKVIKEFKSSYYIMHFSDPHRWERSETPEVAYKEQSVVVDIANIINPEIFIETGDCYWQNTSNIITTKARLAEYMNGNETIRGLNELYAPYFAIPGNHDTPQHNWYKEPNVATSARAWNNLFGLTYHNFIYGNTRLMGITNGWCQTTGGGDPDYVANYQWQLDAATEWIDSVGKGNLRLGFLHVPQESVPPLYNALKSVGSSLGLILGGHIHRWETNPYSIDGKPIIYVADGVQNGKNGAPFNLYKIDDINGTFTPVGNSFAAHSGLEIDKNYNTSKLKLYYANENNGSFTENTATFINKFDFPIEGARVRFVMKKGVLYNLSNLAVLQEFDGDDYHIVDAEVDLQANSITEIKIIPDDECPEDPNKKKPGDCGCGVVEGTCSKYTLTLVSGSGNGEYYPYETVSITAHPAPAGYKFDSWLIDSGNPVILDTTASTTTLQLIDTSATLTVCYIKLDQIYQAEDALFVGPSFNKEKLDYHGSGYLEYKNASNGYIEWTVNVPSAGSYNLNFRYYYPEFSSSRHLKLEVNDQVKLDSLNFPLPFIYINWGVAASTQSLNKGINIIRLSTIGEYGVNIDELIVEPYDMALDEIIYDDFEVGFGNWADSGDDCMISTSNAPQGMQALCLKDSSASSLSSSTKLSLTAYDDMVIEFLYFTTGMKTGDNFEMQISTDGGSSYSIINTWYFVTDFENDSLYSDSITISGYTLTDEIRLRLVCNSNTNGIINFDEIKVSAGSRPKVNTLVSEISDNFAFLQNYPNPFSTETTISFVLNTSCQVSLSIYNLQGKKIYTLIENEFHSSGRYSKLWNPGKVGCLDKVYVSKLKVETRDGIFYYWNKMVCIK